jgi:hypothetical protein
MNTMTRRNLLITTALAGAAAICGLRPRRAFALRIEENEASQRLYFSACEERAAHDQLVRDLIAQLEGQQSHEQAVEAVKAMSCPLCGCGLAATVGALAEPAAAQ